MQKGVYATLIPLYETTCFIQLAVLALRKIEFRTLADQQAKCFAILFANVFWSKLERLVQLQFMNPDTS
jgi:hypothetical protein